MRTKTIASTHLDLLCRLVPESPSRHSLLRTASVTLRNKRGLCLTLALAMAWSLALAPAAVAVSLPAAPSQTTQSRPVPVFRAGYGGDATAPMGLPRLLQNIWRRLSPVSGQHVVPSVPPRTVVTMPGITTLDQVGQMMGTPSPAQVAGWRSALNAAHPAPGRAATLHIWLGEYLLAHEQQPEQAMWHFRAAQALVPSRLSPLHGLAAYDDAIALYYAGAYADAANAFHALLTPRTGAPGYGCRSCALWLRHAQACTDYHASRSRLGIPEPPRLDPLCGVAALSACLHTLRLPAGRAALLASCRVTGEGSSLQDLIDAAPRLGASARAFTADDLGLMLLPKPVVAYVEHDHFVALVRADRKGVSYLCSDCGPWPGGQVDLTWRQWQALEPGPYLALGRPGSPADATLAALLADPSSVVLHRAHLIMPAPARVSMEGSLAGLDLGVRAHLGAGLPALSGHVARFLGPTNGVMCGNKLSALHCNPSVECPMDDGSKCDPVNLATGEEEYSPDPDLTVYNPYGPSVVWGRVYDSLRDGGAELPHGGDPTYQDDDFGVGWSQAYNLGVYDPGSQTTTDSNPKVTQGSQASFPATGNDSPSNIVPSQSSTCWDVTYQGRPIAVSGKLFRYGVTGSYPNSSQNYSGGYYTDGNATHGWTVSVTAKTNGNVVTYSFTVTAPPGATVGPGYEVRYNYGMSAQGQAYSDSAIFDVAATSPASGSAPGSGTKYVVMPNGGRVAFVVGAAPTASSPDTRATVQAGVPMQVDWDYDGSASGHYVITLPDRSQWVTYPATVTLTTQAGFATPGYFYLLKQINSRDYAGNSAQNYLTFGYTSSHGASGYPDLSYIAGSAPSPTATVTPPSGVPAAALLWIQRNAAGNVTQVSDCYGRAVTYLPSTQTGSGVSFEELAQVSQVGLAGAQGVPAHYTYGYQSVATGDGNETAPFLAQISVPSPADTTGSTLSTSTINYAPNTQVVSSLQDSHGNTRAYNNAQSYDTPLPSPAVGGGYTGVTVTDANRNTAVIETLGYDANMNVTYVARGVADVGFKAFEYADPNDPYRPSNVMDGANIAIPETVNTRSGSYETLDTPGIDQPTHGYSTPGNWDIVDSQGNLVADAQSSGWSASVTSTPAGTYGATPFCPYRAQFSWPSSFSFTAGKTYEFRYLLPGGTFTSGYFVGSTNPSNQEPFYTSFLWDQYGNLMATYPNNSVGGWANGGVQSYTWSYANFSLGELTSANGGYPIAAIRTYTYDEAHGGRVQSITNGASYNSSYGYHYTYDGLGNVLSVKSPPGDPNATGPNYVGTGSNAGATTTLSYGSPAVVGLPMAVTDPLGNTTQFMYDLRGNLAGVQDANGYATYFYHDLADDTTETVQPAADLTGTGAAPTYPTAVASYIYPGGPLYAAALYNTSTGNGSAAPTPSGLFRQFRYTLGSENETLGVSGDTPTVSATYDALYQPLTLQYTNASGSQGANQPQFVYFNYDYAYTGNLQSVYYPNPMGTFKFGYDPYGRLTQATDGNGVQANYGYPAYAGANPPSNPSSLLDHLTTLSHPAGAGADDYSIQTDQFGDIDGGYSHSAGGVSTSTAEYGLPLSSTLLTSKRATISYTYNPDNSRATMVTPSGTYTYHYDGDGRPSALVNPLGETTTWSYQPNGWLSQQAEYNAGGQNVVTATYGYDPDGLLTSLNNAQGASTLASYTHMAYDAAGNRLQMYASLPGAPTYSGYTDWTYDVMDQLTGEQSTASAASYNNVYSYDAAGNRLGVQAVGGGSVSFGSVSAANQLSYNSTSYDGNGNPKNYEGQTLTFDRENRLTQIGSLLSAGYTGQGTREWKGVGSPQTYFWYDNGGVAPVFESNSSLAVTATNTFGANGLVSRNVGGASSGSVFYGFDPEGNTALRLNSAGQVLTYAIYGALGSRHGSDGLPQYEAPDPYGGYGGQRGYYIDLETTNSGLELLGERYYDRTVGRFLTPDPTSFLGGINLYAYAGNNPINFADPTGLFTIGPADSPWLVLDSDTVGGGLATGTAAVGSSFSFGLWDGGKYKCDPSFATSLGLANFGRDALIGAVAPEAEGELAEDEVAEGADELGTCLRCFPAGTPVRMADGSTRPVERLQVGDLVASRDPATGRDAAEPVLRTVARAADSLVTLGLADAASGKAETLTCTPEHPFYVQGRGWVPAGALAVGTSIVTRAGPPLTVESVSWRHAAGSGGFRVYNVEVQDTHSYFAGTVDGGAWVHNINCIRENHDMGEAAENEWRNWLENEHGVQLEPKTSVDANGPDAIRTGGNNAGWDYAELKPGNAAGANDGWEQLLTRPGQGYSGTGALYQYTGSPGNFNFTGPFFQGTLF